jgi:hypothetical protein
MQVHSSHCEEKKLKGYQKCIHVYKFILSIFVEFIYQACEEWIVFRL